MSFASCVDQAVQAGKLTKTSARLIKEADDPESAIDDILNELTRTKRETAIQAVRLAEGFEKMSSHPDGLRAGLLALLTKDRTAKSGYGNVEYLAKTYESEFLAPWADALSVFRTRRLGLSQDTERLNKLIKAIYGETVDDAEVMKFAKQWGEITDSIRNKFNEKGGSISKNEKWLTPQNHDARALLALSKDRDKAKGIWKDRIKPLLDREQMTDDLGGRLSDDDFDAALDYSFDTITTGGLNKTKDFTIPRLGKKLSRKGSDRRFLYFKDANSWIAYNKEFGKGDIFTTLTDHIGSKSQDIALMDIFGANPDLNFQALMGMAEKAQPMKNLQKSELEAIWNVVSGKTNQGNLTGVADFFNAGRNIITASTLGGAFISSISDIGMSAITSSYNNVPAFKVLSTQMKLLNPANEADRIFSVRIGLGADAWLGRAQAANRYSDMFGTGATTKIAEGVMRASFLAPWTDAGRKAFGFEFSGMLADNFGKSFNDLNKNVKRAFKTYGINEDDWNSFRSQKPLNYKGATYADMTKEGGAKFHQMVMSETDFAVPTPDARVRAITTGGLGRATVAGQAWRSAMMLKSFPITIATTHFYRAAYQSTTGDKMAYVAALTASASILGGIAVQAKDLAAGREPRPTGIENGDLTQMRDFFGSAVMQGGGLGIFGDLLFSDVNRFGGGITETVTGPTGELIDKTFKLTVGNMQQALKGEETNVLGEAGQFAKRYTPDIWQTRLLTDALADQLLMMSDDTLEGKYNRQMRKRKKEFKQDYWWRKGEVTPEFLQ